MGQTAEVRASIAITKTKTPDGGQSRADLDLSALLSLADGVASGQANVGFIDKARAIADGATEDIDLVGALTDALGDTVNAAEVVAIMIRNVGSTTLTIGGASAEFQWLFAAAGDKFTLRAGECVLAFSNTGWTAGAGSTDDLRVVNASGAAGAFDFGVVGRTS